MSKLSDKMNKRVAALTPAAILTFNQKISAIPDIVKLTLGEPDFNTPEHVKQAAIKAIDDNESHYTNSRGRRTPSGSCELLEHEIRSELRS